ncbi:anaphase promoting complex subunit CDC16 [Aspergillus melleus]|uniref:anaphase promoting complex subunit CDC16 n=1 Tax=Aspergillus melleus TaxID=138277 RepID=UPI001E8D6AA3|nr:anaphase-promoting complex subunit Cut9 [Aspergillus melleus]KAH8425271.1 anaphase-promoting complex subunit Cut9 [Aspergillus melleus]
MDGFLRNWRQDALNRGQFDSAVYIGDKVFALTSEAAPRGSFPSHADSDDVNWKDSDSDAFWLAQVHFSNTNYTRALALLTRKDLISRSAACRYLAAHCYIKQNHFEQALSVLGDHNPTHLFRSKNSRRKIQHVNGPNRIALRNGKNAATSRLDPGEDRERDEYNNVRFEAAMCYLRGLCFAKQNAFDRARDCYKDAVRIDVQCFEAFDQLMKNSLMSPAEELEFLESLDFDSVGCPDASIAQEAAHFTKMLYTTRLSKYSSPSILSDATETLSTHYKLADNPDILLSRAEALYTQCRFAEALELTSSILSNSESSTALTTATAPHLSAQNHLGHAPAVYPLHLACLYETGATNSLFLLSHTLADHAPEESYTYLAIGVYYLSVSKVAEARRFFSKASLLDPHSAPAWIGFAHTFAAEGEHDQAIAAYSTAARLFQGSHLPQLFLGMQHLALNNMSLAHEYLCAAYAMSTGAPSGSVTSITALPSSTEGHSLGGDPLVLNELGVVLYHQNQLESAIELFRQSLALATSLHCEPGAWVATRANLGHALRRIGRFTESLNQFDECLRIGAAGASIGYSPFLGGSGGHASGVSASGVGGYEDRGLVGSLHTARGLVLLELGRTMEAVTALHEAVRVLGASGGGDAAGGAGIAGTLLSRALEIWAVEGHGTDSTPESGRSGSSRSSARASRDKGKGKSARRRVPTEESYAEEWTDDVPQVDSQTMPGESATLEKVEMELDDEADGLLRQAMGRTRDGHSRRPGRTPELDLDDTPAAAGGRHRGSRTVRSNARH